MDGDSYESHTYKLKSAGPTPYNRGRFVIQTFGIEKNKVTTYPATTTINRSDDMTGIYGGIYISANWQRLPYLSVFGNQLFSGSTVNKPEWLDQDELT